MGLEEQKKGFKEAFSRFKTKKPASTTKKGIINPLMGITKPFGYVKTKPKKRKGKKRKSKRKKR
jgi:hypothetical protein